MLDELQAEIYVILGCRAVREVRTRTRTYVRMSGLYPLGQYVHICTYVQSNTSL